MKQRIQLVIRVVVIAFCCFLTFGSVLVIQDTIPSIVGNGIQKNVIGTEELDDWYLYYGDYEGLYERMGWDYPMDARYADYWDIADVYDCFRQVQFWDAVQEKKEQEGDTAGVLQAGEYCRKEEERIRAIYQNSGELGKKHIEKLVGDRIGF